MSDWLGWIALVFSTFAVVTVLRHVHKPTSNFFVLRDPDGKDQVRIEGYNAQDTVRLIALAEEMKR